MATLEKIRSKSVLLVVIIAVALLAFILGDAITNGRNLFGNNTTVAKVGKDKIEIQDYQRKQQELSNQIEEGRKQNPQQYANFDSQVLSQQAIEELVDERLVGNAVEAVGIKTTPELLRFFMIENPNTVIPEMQRLITGMQQSGVNVRTPEEAYMVIFTPQNYGLSERQVQQFQQAWLALESRYSQLISQMLYGQLLNGSFKANKLDVEAMRKDYVATASLKVAKKPYGELSEKEYPVSDDEIRKAYEDRKEQYAIDETTKEISFISVNVTPSAKDMEEASVLAATVVTELKGSGVSKETRKNGLDIQRHDIRLADVKDVLLKNFLSTAPVDSVSVLQSNARGFKVAKLNSRANRVDSLELSSIAVQGNGTVVESVLAYANSGLPLDSINNKFSADSVVYSGPQWVALYNSEGSAPKFLGLQESVYDSLYNSNGSYMILDQQEGMAVIGTVTKKSAPKEVVEYETVDYILHPSDATLAEAREKLQKFITDNNTASKFVDNASAAGYVPFDIAITPSTPAVPTQMSGRFYPDSRALVRWVVMDGKDGEVSKIYQSKDAASPNLYVAAILDSYEDYVPWDNRNVKDELTAKVRRDKAGDKMVKQYAKSTVEASAAAMQVEPVEVASLQSTKRDMTVTDNKVKGRIMGSKADGKVKTAKGDDGVYVYVITATGEEPVEMDDEQFAGMFLNLHRVNPSAVLRGNKKVEYNVYKFEQGE
ncbi:MAG: SurA N-terminal domain-containing protein [Muribaculaceae bacterium]|nr:SurA N-terminal domain-containing protein [Muribaculaceae bacterium]